MSAPEPNKEKEQELEPKLNNQGSPTQPYEHQHFLIKSKEEKYRIQQSSSVLLLSHLQKIPVIN